MSGRIALKAYLGSYPRITLVFVAVITVSGCIAFWRFGPVAAICAVAIYFLLTILLKLLLLLWFHPKQFDFPRPIAPVLLSALLLGAAATALQLPMYQQMCTVDPASLAETHLCPELTP